MDKRGPRPVVFVCIGMNKEDNEFVSKVIQAVSQEEAASLFFEKVGLKAQAIHGPFRPKRAQIIENTRNLKFTDLKKKAIYNNWEVDAFILKEPENHAYLLFIKRVDDKVTQPAPKGTIIVPVSDLRFNDE
jgi:hypothetical protein